MWPVQDPIMSGRVVRNADWQTVCDKFATKFIFRSFILLASAPLSGRFFSAYSAFLV
jgi:hypothetical protein